MTPTVSVVLPTRNRASTLNRAVLSVLGQSHAALELIVVDDASEDATPALLRGIHDPRLTIVRNPQRLGVGGARNAGIALARGEWLAFQDSDDEWRIDKLEKQLQVAASDVVLILCGNLYVNDIGMSFMSMNRPEPATDMAEQIALRIPGAPCWLVRRSAVLAAGGFDPEMNCFEDWELALRLSTHGRVLMINEPLVICERTLGSLFSTERNFIPNLKLILGRHRERLLAHPFAWAFYCNLLGQTLCQFDHCAEGRFWFREAIRSRPGSLRSWLNLLTSTLGASAFRTYVSVGRRLRSRLAQPARLVLHRAGAAPPSTGG